MPEFIYRDEDHSYWLNGVRLPGVTEILTACGLINTRNHNEFARQRGKAVHKAIELWLKNDLDEDSLDPQIVPYMEAFKAFKDDVKPEINADEVEVPRYHPILMYGGTPDIPCRINNNYSLVDIKTGGKEDWHGIQLIGYTHLLEGVRIRYGLYLRDDGTYRLVGYNDRHDRDVWIACLNIYKWREERRLI